MTQAQLLDGVILQIDGARVGTILTAPIAGRFLRRHPLRAAPLARPGEVIREGDAIGLLAVGPILVPVTMPADGLVLWLAAADGEAIGYGDRLAVIIPLTELASMGIAP